MKTERHLKWSIAGALGLVLLAWPGPVTRATDLAKATDPDENVRIAALRALGQTRDPAVIAVLTKALEDRFAIVHQAAVDALVELGAAAWPTMRELVGSTNIARRAGAVLVLAATNDLANAEALARAARDEVWDVREPAIAGLVRLGVPALEAILPLAQETQGRAAGSALRVLAQWGPAAKTAEAVVRAQLANAENTTARHVAAYALMQIGPDIAASLPLFRELWPTLPDQERLWLAIALARQGVAALPAADLIEQQLSRADAEQGPLLAAGLVRMGPSVRDAVIGRLSETVQGGNKQRAFQALTVLGWFGEHAAAALPLLIQEFKAGRDPWFAMAAADAIGAQGPAARAAAPVLTEYVQKSQATPPGNASQRELLERAIAALAKINAPATAPGQK